MKLSEESSKLLNLCLNTRCNYCRSPCPLYNLTKVEFDSPRAKLELVFEALNGRIDIKEARKVLPSCPQDCQECFLSCPHKINPQEIFKEFKNLTE
jgi:Fe-S oxidoreductase